MEIGNTLQFFYLFVFLNSICRMLKFNIQDYQSCNLFLMRIPILNIILEFVEFILKHKIV